MWPAYTATCWPGEDNSKYTFLPPPYYETEIHLSPPSMMASYYESEIVSTLGSTPIGSLKTMWGFCFPLWIRNVGKIWTSLGPLRHFGPVSDQVPNCSTFIKVCLLLQYSWTWPPKECKSKSGGWVGAGQREEKMCSGRRSVTVAELILFYADPIPVVWYHCTQLNRRPRTFNVGHNIEQQIEWQLFQILTFA